MAIFSKLFFVHLNPRLPLALTLALTLTNPSPTPCEDLAQKQNIETNEEEDYDLRVIGKTIESFLQVSVTTLFFGTIKKHFQIYFHRSKLATIFK